MIGWYDPSKLVLLALIPGLVLVLAWTNRRRERALRVFIATPLLGVVVPDLDRRRRCVRIVCRIAAVLCLVLALGGPMWGETTVAPEGLDLVVVLDTSRSMLAADESPRRLDAARGGLRALLAELRGDRIGLVVFAGAAFLQCPLTLDYPMFAEHLQTADVDVIPRGGTALAVALETGLKAFDGGEGKHRALLLITDGEDHDGNVKRAARHAATQQVPVFAVGIGTRNGGTLRDGSGKLIRDSGGAVVRSRLGEQTLKYVALQTGGVYVHGTGPLVGLVDLYRNHIGKLERRRVAAISEQRAEHRFQFPLAAAFVLLAVEQLISERRGKRGA